MWKQALMKKARKSSEYEELVKMSRTANFCGLAKQPKEINLEVWKKIVPS